MTKFEELLQQYVNKDYDELLSIAKGAVNRLLPLCRKHITAPNGDKIMVMWTVLAAYGADGVLTATERRFVCDLLEIDNESLDTLSKKYSSIVSDSVNSLADNTERDIKDAVLTLILAVSACDEKISRQETEFIRRILY